MPADRRASGVGKHAGRKMPGSGTRNFLDPESYPAGLRVAAREAVVTPHGEFSSRLTWAELL